MRTGRKARRTDLPPVGLAPGGGRTPVPVAAGAPGTALAVPLSLGKGAAEPGGAAAGGAGRWAGPPGAGAAGGGVGAPF